MKRLAVFILLGCALMAGGCSSYSIDYIAWASKPLQPGSIEGPWEGQWVSKGGHHGKLRCLMQWKTAAAATTPTARPATYEAKFEAKFFWDLFTAHYSTLLSGARSNGVTTLSGDHKLTGLGGGMYHYEARVTPTNFDATYRSEADEGEFHMHRHEN